MILLRFTPLGPANPPPGQPARWSGQQGRPPKFFGLGGPFGGNFPRNQIVFFWEILLFFSRAGPGHPMAFFKFVGRENCTFLFPPWRFFPQQRGHRIRKINATFVPGCPSSSSSGPFLICATPNETTFSREVFLRDFFFFFVSPGAVSFLVLPYFFPPFFFMTFFRCCWRFS